MRGESFSTHFSFFMNCRGGYPPPAGAYYAPLHHWAKKNFQISQPPSAV